MAVVRYINLAAVIILCWCQLQSCPIDRRYRSEAFALHRSLRIFKQSCGIVTKRAAQSNTLHYQAIELDQYAPNHRSDYSSNQQNISSVPLVVTPSISIQNKYGVTSIHVRHGLSVHDTPSDLFHVIVGTKYGELVSLLIEHRNVTWLVSRRVPVEWPSPTNVTKGKSPSPNYCIASIDGTTKTTFLVGSADRYVYVWQMDHTKLKWTNTNSRWNMTQRLGPHTGWVKSLVVLPSVSPSTGVDSPSSVHPIDTNYVQYRFLSIGCNRMEQWVGSRCQNNEKTEWTHLGTTSISSTPTLPRSPVQVSSTTSGTVCTLSSDLLCLEVCTIVTSNAKPNTIIAVGGVDGRIHFYNDRRSVTECLEHLATVIAHQGRVNVLCYDATRQLLLSGSHDGTLHGWSFDMNSICRTFVVDRIATYRFQDGNRITALLCFIPEGVKSSYINIIAGTQNGSIHLLAMRYNVDLDKHDIVQRSNISIDGCEPNANGPMLNTFCRLHSNNSKHQSADAFIVGHSHGMGIVKLQDDTEGHP